MRRRKNPSLVILGNPAGLSQARKAWSKFHLRDGTHANVRQIPDVNGVPREVMVLGAFEGGEFCETRDWGCEPTILQLKRNMERGPWLVSDASMKRLWVVAKNAQDLSRLRRHSGEYMKAIYYWPPKNSGKYHPRLAYRHAFGEVWSDEAPKPRWAKVWPKVRITSGGRCLVIERPRGGYTVEEDGIVG